MNPNTMPVAAPQSAAPSKGRQMLNKVPEITLYFWIIKILCTTVGETFADYLNENLGLGLSKTSYIMTAVLIAALVVQFIWRSYKPAVYWFAVVAISVVGTLISDNLVDGYGIALQTTTIAFSIALAIVFAAWYASEKTLSIHTIVTTRREGFYWGAVLFTFALGTSAGDYLSEALNLGYTVAVVIFASAIAVVIFAHKVLKMNAILSFWIAYILTRPLGGSIGDLMSQPKADGGLGFGTTVTSLIFLITILSLVVYLTVTKVDEIPVDIHEVFTAPDAGEEPRVLIVTNHSAVTPALVETVRKRAAAGPASFYVLIPNPAHGEFDRLEDVSAGEELQKALPLLEEPSGGKISGRVAKNPNAYDDIVDELRGGGYHEIILETPRAHHASHWLHIDLPDRIEHLGYPLTTVHAAS
jgi:uncharacterized membrane-anchored protein